GGAEAERWRWLEWGGPPWGRQAGLGRRLGHDARARQVVVLLRGACGRCRSHQEQPDTSGQGGPEAAQATLWHHKRSVPPDAPVDEAEPAHLLGVVDVAAIHHNRPPHKTLDLLEVKLPELVPLSHDDDGVGASRDTLRVATVVEVRQE